MNQLLQNRYNELGAEEISRLRHRLSDSPRALLLFDLLEKRRGKKLNTIDAVDFVYKGESGNFETLRNRFFKLRKQVIGYFSEPGGEAGAGGIALLPLEEQLYRCRQLISENHFQLARNELRQLIADCRKQNVFEVLPEAISQLVYCNMAMNVLRDNERLLRELTDASALLNDLRHAQALSRNVYLLTHTRQGTKIPALLRQMRRLSIVRAGFPRFRLFYHFTVVGYTVGLPGFSTKAHARHLTALKRLMEANPGMPAGYYEPNSGTIMQFYLLSAEGTSHFMKGDVAACYSCFKEAWEIMERTPNLRVRRSESFFANRIAIEVATGRYREALKTAEHLIDFQKEQRQEEKRLKGYAEMAVIYSYAYPALRCPNPDFLARQLKTYISVLRKNDSPMLADGLSTQAIFSFLCGDWKGAQKVLTNPRAKEVFTKMDLDFYNRLLVLTPSSPAADIEALRRELERLLHAAVSSDRVFSLRRGLNLLKRLDEERKTLKKK